MQIAAEGKLLLARRTRETGALRVNANVSLQVGQTRERFVAPVAPVLIGRRPITLIADFIRNSIGRFLGIGQGDFR